MKRFNIIPLLKYVLGFGLLGVVVAQYWNNGLADALRQPIRLLPLACAAALCATSLLVTFVRWYTLVRAQDLPLTFTGALRLGMVGNYFNALLPGSVGGDLVKAAALARQQDRRTVAVATVVVDRAVGLCGLVWVVAVLGGLFWVTGALDALTGGRDLMTASLKAIVTMALAVVAGSVAFWVVLGVVSGDRARRLGDRLARVWKVGGLLAEFWRAMWLYRCRGRAVGLALLMAMLGHVGFIGVFYFAALTMTPAETLPPLGSHFLFVPVGMVIEAGFPTPGGVGGGEFGFGKLYEEFGGAFSAGVLASLVKRVLGWGVGLAGYLVYLRLRPSLPARAGADAVPEPAPGAAA